MIIPYDFSPILGGDRSIQFSPADIRNMYITRDPATGRLGWHDFPGLKKINTDTSPDRGQWEMNGIRYVITGTNFQSEDEYGNRTVLGTVAGSERAIFADDGTNILFVTESVLYRWNGATLSDITSSLPFTSPEWVDFGYNHFFAGRDSQWGVSNSGDLTTWNSADTDNFDQNSDSLVRGYLFQGLFYAFGTKSTENWVYTGTGNPPLSRRGSTLQNIGIAGKWAICNSDSYLYWLGDDRRVYKGAGTSAIPVSTQPVHDIIDGYNYINDCIMSSFTMKGQVFILMKFTTAGDTLLYCETSDYWVTLSDGTNRYIREAWIGNAVHKCYEKNLVTDATTGHTYELDHDTFTDNGNPKLRILVGNPVTGAAIGKPENQILFKSLVIPMQTGVGLATGQGSTPEIICEISPSGGQIYETQNLISIGVMGDYSRKVKFDWFATGYEMVPRVMISDPVPWTVYQGGTMDIEDAGY